MFRAVAVVGVVAALSIGAYGAHSSVLLTARQPAAATAHTEEPELAMTRIRPAASPARPVTDLILVTAGKEHDLVLSAGSARGWPEALVGDVSWSPDGRRLAFTRITGPEFRGAYGVRMHRHDIFVVNSDGSGLRRLTRTGDALDPVWSPDGQEIVFAREHFYLSSSQQEGSTAALWMLHADGSDVRELTDPVLGQGDEPGSFSPNGRWLAFTRTEPSPPVGLLPNTSSVYLLDLASGDVRRLAGQASGPSFSPNGRWIALSSTRDHNGTHQAGEDAEAYAGELYLVDPTGTDWRRLTYTRGVDEEAPTFSPDGTRIAYVRIDAIRTAHVIDNDHHTIYELNSDGACPTRLRDGVAFEYYAPAWRPGRGTRDSGRLHCVRGAVARSGDTSS